jgi:putative addiction module component (TIGR02574 family)
MNDRVKSLSLEARKLTADERFELVEAILASVHEPDSAIDAAWAREAKDRLDAWRRGELSSRSAEDVFAKHLKP